MTLWILWLVVGVILLIVEIFTPFLFFLNLGFAALITAVLAYFMLDLTWQILGFAVLATIFLLVLRPFLVKKVDFNPLETGIEAKYIGKTARTVMDTNSEAGRITIYGEEWVARSINGENIPIDVEVKIVRNDGTVFFVEKI